MVRLAHSCWRNWGGGQHCRGSARLPARGGDHLLALRFCVLQNLTSVGHMVGVQRICHLSSAHPMLGWLVSNQHMKAKSLPHRSLGKSERKVKCIKNVNSGVSLPVFKITVYILPPSTKDLKQLMSVSTNSRALTRH